jgi:hypothetical protein
MECENGTTARLEEPRLRPKDLVPRGPHTPASVRRRKPLVTWGA